MNKVTKVRRSGAGKKGIVMVGGVVLKNGLDSFEADEKLVQKTLSRVSNISKGLYSGIMNADPDFIKFQEESMKRVMEEEATELCGEVVLGAEKQLMNISKSILVNNRASYAVDRRMGVIPEADIEPIELCEDKNDVKKTKIKKRDSSSCRDLIEKHGDKLASLNEEEIQKIKEISKEAKKVVEFREKIKKKITKKQSSKKKAVKKTVNKKVAKKKAKNNDKR